MTTTIRFFPSKLSDEPLEVHITDKATIHDWLLLKCPSYSQGDVQPVSVFIDGNEIVPSEWPNVSIEGKDVSVYPIAKGDPITWVVIAVVALVAAVAYVATMPKPGAMSTQQFGNQGRRLTAANLKANTPRLNQVIPEIAGQYKIFPDYLNQPRRYFKTPTTQSIDVLLCLGSGEFQIDGIFIGDTPSSDFGADFSYTLYSPNALIGHQAALNWHNAEEVSNTSFSAGIRLTASSEANMSSPGEPAKLIGSAATQLNFAASPVTFTVTYHDNSRSITFNTNFANAAAVVTALNSAFQEYTTTYYDEWQYPYDVVVPAMALTATQTGGVITLTATENEPIAISVSDAFSRVFGASPTTTAGAYPKGKWIGPYRASPANEAVSKIEVDIFCPSGLGWVNDGGGVDGRTRTFEVEWTASDSSTARSTFSISGGTRDQIGTTVSITLPAPKTGVEVRVRRVEFENTNTRALDRLEWYGLRTLLLDNVDRYPGVTVMAITLNGIDELSSRTNDQFNLIVTRKLNGVATRSIAKFVRHICTSIGYQSTDINEAELSSLEAIWDARGDYFDMGYVDSTTVKEALTDCLRVGFAELTVDQGKIRPVRDQARSTYEHVYTPQNMLKPLKRKFSAYDPDEYDGVDVEFVNADTWQDEVVECRLPGDVGVRTEKLKIDGCTSRARAWRIGMRERRALKYRRKLFSFSTELDALNSRYFSYCVLTDDVPGYAQSSLIVDYEETSGGATYVTSSEQLNWVVGATHVVGFRRPDGTLAGPFTATKIDDFRFTIASPLDFDVATIGDNIEATHIVFGTSTKWAYPVLITEISPSGDGVDVEAVNYDVRVYADDDNYPQ